MKLLDDDELGRSAVVANCRMNRERDLAGSNGYEKEIGFAPLESLMAQVPAGRPLAWLDLCCGTGKALIRAARIIQTEYPDSAAEIVGVDLVGMFHPCDPGIARLQLVEASLSAWSPGRTFDLITCVHGLHYIGDKLGLIARAASWLVKEGLLVANLDLANIKMADATTGRKLVADLRRAGLHYDRRKRLIVYRGSKVPDLPFRYVGADDRAGPNYPGQPVLDSYYESVSDRRWCRPGSRTSP